MSISVVICTRNRPREVLHCLGSLLTQTLPPHEVVVVDSSDTPELADALHTWSGAESVDVQYVHSDPGLTHQRNVGVAHSSGEIVFFLDDDILLEPEFIAEIMKVFEADVNGRVGGAMGAIIGIREHRLLEKRWDAILRTLFFMQRYGDGSFLASGLPTWPHGEDRAHSVEFLSGGLTAYRRVVLDEFRFDENLPGYGLLEDAEFSYRVSRKYRNVYVPTARCAHLKTASERIEGEDFVRMYRQNHAYLFRKNMPQTPPNRITFHLSMVGLTVLTYLHGQQFRNLFDWRRLLRAVMGERVCGALRSIKRLMAG